MNIRNFIDAPKPEPIASPSGKLCSAKPIPTIIPVLSNEFLLLLTCLFFTALSQNIIIIIPNIRPKKLFTRPESFNASGIKSKQIIAIIRPAANCKIKLKNSFEVLLKVTPIIPPIVVPKVPKNKPTNVVFSK